jgi:mycothiol synthase
VAHGGTPAATEREVGHWVSLPSYVLWIAEAGGQIVAYADVNERPGKERYWLYLRALRPEGAAALIAETFAYAAPRAGPGALIHAAAPGSDRATHDVLRAHGFRHVRYELEMRIDLDAEPPEPVWPEGIEVRSFRPGEDEEAAWQADTEAFADHWEFTPDPYDDFEREVFGHPAFDPSLFFLPVQGDKVAGLSFCLLRDLGETVGWIEILGVRRAWRRRGLALALLHHSFRELRAQGARWAGLEVDAENLTGAVRLYERAGMRPVRQEAIFEGPVVPLSR